MQKHVHGGDVYSHRDCLDFSANCNPLGTPENVRKQSVTVWIIKEYPQVGYRPLREAIGQYEDVSPRTYHLWKWSSRTGFFSLSGSKTKGTSIRSLPCGI